MLDYKKIKKEYKRLREKIYKYALKKTKFVISYLKYDYKISMWRFLNRSRRYSFLLLRYAEISKRISLIVISLVGSYIVVRLFDVSSLSTDELASYFISIGAMTGGIIAIVFTLSIFTKQNLLELHSAGELEQYTYDWKEKIIYFVIIITAISFLTFGIFLNGSVPNLSNNVKTVSIYISLSLIGLMFALIDWQYEIARKKVNPRKVIGFLKKKALHFLEVIEKDIRRIAGIIKFKNKLKNKNISDNVTVASVRYKLFQKHFSTLDYKIENIFEITIKLSNKHEMVAANEGISAIYRILCKYLDLVKDSSFSFPSSASTLGFLGFLTPQSDSANFLSKSLERLNKLGEIFIKEDKMENALFVVDVYRELAVYSKDIKFIKKPNENLVFEQIKSYLSLYVNFATKQKSQDVPFRSVRVFGDLAAIAIEKNLLVPLNSIQDSIYKLALFGIAESKIFVTNECYNNWLRALKLVFIHRFYDIRHQIPDILENIRKVTVATHRSISLGYLKNDFTNQLSLSKPYDEMTSVVIDVINAFFDEPKNGKNRLFYKTHLVDLLGKIRMNLRLLSEEIKNCDDLLVGSIGRMIYQLNSLIIDLLNRKEFSDVYEDLIKELGGNIHLPTWFVHYADSFKTSTSFNELNETIIKTGLDIFKVKKHNNLIEDCVEALYSIVKNSLYKNEGSYGFYEPPRIMLKICYLGILALKYDKQDILKDIGVKIYEFEELYKQRYIVNLNLPKCVDPKRVMGVPKENQLYITILKWRNKFMMDKYNRSRILNDSEDMMFDLIDIIDIDRFIFNIWESFPEGSSVEQEVEEILKRGKNH